MGLCLTSYNILEVALTISVLRVRHMLLLLLLLIASSVLIILIITVHFCKLIAKLWYGVGMARLF